MAESSGQVKTLLEDIITRLDAQAATSEKRHEDQLTFNAQISTDLASFRKQLVLTQNDVDDTRKALSASPASAASVGSDRRAVSLTTSPQIEGGATPPPARLANDGAPLMPEPPAAQMVPQP